MLPRKTGRYLYDEKEIRDACGELKAKLTGFDFPDGSVAVGGEVRAISRINADHRKSPPWGHNESAAHVDSAGECRPLHDICK